MPTNEEEAEKVIKDYTTHFGPEALDSETKLFLKDSMITALIKVAKESREAALEEAAQVADKRRDEHARFNVEEAETDYRKQKTYWLSKEACVISITIRQLKEPKDE